MFSAHTAFGRAEFNTLSDNLKAQSTAFARQSNAISAALSAVVDRLNRLEQAQEARVDPLNFVFPSSNSVVPRSSTSTDPTLREAHLFKLPQTNAHPLDPSRVSVQQSLTAANTFVVQRAQP